MSRFSGPQWKGALRAHRQLLHREATERNARTPVERTRRFRRTAEQAAAIKAVRKARRAAGAS